ncbi:uncharacterized protein LOC124355650 [Homalodisca vitripennis]|uniref:uncharacterized protein LOC124355650 n=1 Tax=Homalodisca vitripennis TaxID=197043 RepID=UPI001EEA6229|nr:uncharacterized protein LOC124355650 [Homalodisca vitripennis]
MAFTCFHYIRGETLIYSRAPQGSVLGSLFFLRYSAPPQCAKVGTKQRRAALPLSPTIAVPRRVARPGHNRTRHPAPHPEVRTTAASRPVVPWDRADSSTPPTYDLRHKMPDGCQSAGDLNNNGGGAKCGSGACYGGGVSSGAGSGSTTPPRRVQVTAKILFGSVSAISTMKHNEKMQRKKSQ